MHFIIVLFRAVCQRLTFALQSHAPRGLDVTTRAQSAGPEEGGGGIQPTKTCRTGQGASCFTDPLLLFYQCVHRHLKLHQLMQILVVSKRVISHWLWRIIFPHCFTAASLQCKLKEKNCIFSGLTVNHPADSQSILFSLGASGKRAHPVLLKGAKPADQHL